MSLLLSLPISAYHASIVADEDDVAFLLTSTVAYRLAPGGPAAAMPLDLGYGATTTRSSFAHWSEGAVFKTPKIGGAPRRVVALPERPQLLVASGEELAWLRRSAEGRFSLEALLGGKTRTSYTSPGSIDAVTMLGDTLFFVERPAGSDWRIGRVTGTGRGGAVFTPLRQGRSPAMLVARHGVTYYDGNRREVRRLSPDLRDEQTLASDFICSPLAVTDHVYCARPEGIFELVPGAPPRRLVSGHGVARPVTDLAANASRLLWVVDAGTDRLEVRALARSP